MADAPLSKKSQKLRIPGIETVDLRLNTRHWETIKVKEARSFDINIAREGSADTPEIVTDPDDVIEIELVDGNRLWTSRRRLSNEVLRDTVQRSADGTLMIPAALPARGASRGLVGKLLIKTLRLFKIDIPQFAAEKISQVFEDRTLTQGPGLYQCAVSDSFGLTRAATITTDRPILLFLHGTASSTQGSFGRLWDAERSSVRESLFKPYRDQVFGLEHKTLTESPITNAIDLADSLPVGARLHLISHSRGGLIGELLCRAATADGRDPFDNDDLNVFRKADRDGERGDLVRLNTLLKKKNVRVERFVRVACPAKGTTLASERLDLYLSVIFNLIKQVPVLGIAYDIFTELIMAIAKERSDPDVLPGLEAQIPNSPLIALLNRPDRSVSGELRVIAGDIEGDSLSAALGTLLIDPLYLDDHDLVVNTDAMFGGSERQDAKYSFHRGAQVSHFRYFANEESTASLVRAITRPSGEDDGFEPFSVQQLDKGVVPYKRDGGQPKPIVFVLPGIMGSHLAVGKDRIWIDPIDLAFGGLSRLSIESQGVWAEAPVSMAYEDLIRFLDHTHEVVPFAYDWRISLLTEAGRLADAIERALDDAETRNHPVSVIAHSMGGLLARSMIATRPETWERVCKHADARLIMLGTPNGGSYIIPLVLTARESLVKQLAFADFTQSESELLDILRFYPGLMEMMPATDTEFDFFLSETWNRFRGIDEKRRKWKPPDTTLLENARVFRNLIDSKKTIFPERMFYIAGIAPATPIGLAPAKDDEGNERLTIYASPHGDGRVLWSTGQLPGVKTWYTSAVHGDLADHKPAFPAILDLLQKGTTQALTTVPPSTRGIPDRFELPEQKTPLYPDAESLARSALGSARTRRRAAEVEERARVTITHGNLAFANYPVMVGHYEGDTIVSAELQLDRALDGRLRDRLRLGLYPGAQDTEIVFLPAEARHAGAIVVGLGPVGSLSPGGLIRAVSRGARAYAVAHAESQYSGQQETQKIEPANLSALLIGTGAGGFSVEDSIAAILRGIAHANQSLKLSGSYEKVRIDAVEFLELYEDRAIEAARALSRIKNDPELSRGFELNQRPVIVRRRGSRRRASFGESYGWWQRLQITEDTQGRLVFNLLTDRARTQAYLQPTQRALVDQFIDGAMHTAGGASGIAVTLFEMLVPNELKDRAPDQRDLVLILNDAAARYPWELMQDRGAVYDSNKVGSHKPLAIQAGMVRQLQSVEFRERVLIAQGKTALVVGDPPSSFVPLPGAVNEARAVEHRLKETFDVIPVIRPGSPDDKEVAGEILQRLYEREYRIVHLAGHGVYEYRSDKEPDADKTRAFTGMVIGKGKFLTPAEIRQMRAVPELVFINCCHLGRIEDSQTPRNDLPRLAANVATELIRMGVRAVVAAGWAVDDHAAETFADVFYREMLSGVPFGKAVQSARKETFEAYPGVNTWGAYQCYGDHAFTLFGDREFAVGNHSDMQFVSPAEALVELENISEDATTATEADIVRLTQRVNEIEEVLPPDWLARGDIQAAIGLALGELGFFQEAVEHYKTALHAEMGQVSVRAAEQLCNFQSRLAVTLSDYEEAKRNLAEARARLIALNEHLGVSVERLSLLGGLAKRKVLVMRSQRDKERALIEVRDAYYEAHKLSTQDNKQVNPYPLLNFVTADFLLALRGRKGLTKQEIDSLVQEAAAAAGARHLVNPNFWDAVASVDCLLVQYLTHGGMTGDIAELAERYTAAKKRAASPREFRSILDQLDFLVAAVVLVKSQAESKRLKKGLAELQLKLRQ